MQTPGDLFGNFPYTVAAFKLKIVNCSANVTIGFTHNLKMKKSAEKKYD
jgi:hypothetical protein